MEEKTYLERLNEYDAYLTQKCKDAHTLFRSKKDSAKTPDFATMQDIAKTGDMVMEYINIRRDLHNRFPELGKLEIDDLLKLLD
tara:strand:+ start:476 stop:727 length:252 start_codon:yes stop_codon:yes gene_type:complete